MKKGYSFDKKDAIDADYVEKADDYKSTEIKKKLSFPEKISKASGKLNDVAKKIDTYNKKAKERKLSNLEYEAKKTKLEAQIAKNKKNSTPKNKSKNKKDNKGGGGGFGLDFGGGFF